MVSRGIQREYKVVKLMNVLFVQGTKAYGVNRWNETRSVISLFFFFSSFFFSLSLSLLFSLFPPSFSRVTCIICGNGHFARTVTFYASYENNEISRILLSIPLFA